MVDWQIVFILLCLTSGLLTLWVAGISWRRRNVNGATEFTMLALVGSAWSLLYVAELATRTPNLMIAFSQFKQVTIIWITVPWTLFALRFFIRDTSGTNPFVRWMPYALSVLPAIATVLLFTSDLYIADYTVKQTLNMQVVEITPGPFLNVLLVQVYLFTVVGTGLLLIASVRFFRERRRQPLVLFMLVFLPAINGIIPLISNLSVDFTPLTFSITAIVLGVVLLRLRIFDLLPVAYDRVVAGMTDGVMIVDTETRILDMNPTMETVTGVKLTDVYGHTVKESFPLLRDLCDKYQGSNTFFEELHWQDRRIEVRVSPLYDSTKRLKGRLMVFHDVTERYRIEQERSNSERRYRALFSRATDAIFLMDSSGTTIIDVNSAASQLLGYTHEELIGMAMLDLQTDDQREEVSGATKPRFEIHMRHKDGHTIPCELSLAPIVEDDNTLLLAIIRDITERKAVENDLNTRLQQLQVLRQVSDEIGDTLVVDHVLMISLDAALRLSAGHAGFIALLNDMNVMALKTIGSYASLNGTGTIDLQDPVLQKAIHTQDGVYIPDLSTTDEPGDHLPNSAARIVVPLISRYNVIGLLNLETNDIDRFSPEVFEFMQILADRIAVAMDNARLYKQAQVQIEELRALYEQVSYLEGIKTDMIRIAAHDLRNPLSVLLGYLTVFEMDKDDFEPEFQEYIDTMLNAVRRMNVMIDDILSLERIERMATQDAGEPFDLLERVTEAVKEFSKQAQEKSIQFTYTPPEVEAITILGDAPQLYEALTNLISNAIKYTPEGGNVSVEIDVSELDSVAYRVTDTGIGIPRNQQDRLFQPFFRVKDEKTRKVQGTGLGLHLVKNIVERHKGAMIFQSTYGEGSTFGFSLPLYTKKNVPA